MQSVASVETVPGRGLGGDVYARPESTCRILLTENETLPTPGSEPETGRENISTARRPCERMNEIRPGLMHVPGGRRGALARVLHRGIEHCGDSIAPRFAPASRLAAPRV